MDMITTTGNPLRFAGLAADDYGCSDVRPPLVLLHGMTFDRTMWRDIVAELQRVDPERRVLALDLPGHGESPEQPTYEMDDIARQVDEAVHQAGLATPVVVGHSAGGFVASIYAGRYPVRGVVNIDQPLQTVAFAGLIRSLAERLRGPDFPGVWQMFYDSFHAELLPEAARQLVHDTCRPRQQVVLGYWRAVLEQPVADLVAWTEHLSADLRASGVPYRYVAGTDLDPAYREWLAAHLPDASVEVWPGTGHFPHLADPPHFARLLASTAQWNTPTTKEAVR